jgi:hypothetical protein
MPAIEGILAARFGFSALQQIKFCHTTQRDWVEDVIMPGIRRLGISSNPRLSDTIMSAAITPMAL